MSIVKSFGAICLIAATAFAQELNWTELARRPELWPAQCTVKAAMRFDGGVTVQAGQKVNVLQLSANEVQLSTTDGRTTFAAEPDETDALVVARAAYAKLTAKQRVLSYESLLRQKDLWPQHVTLTKTLDLGGGRSLPAGDQLLLVDVQPGKLLVNAEKLNGTLNVVPQATDFMARARRFVEDETAGPRLATQRKIAEEKQNAQGAIISELDGKLVSSVTGSPQPLDDKSLPRYIVFYRGASTCPITRQFTPALIKYYQQMKPQHPEFEIVYLMTEPMAETKKFAQEIGFSWRAVEYETIASMPRVRQPITGLLPQLIVMDRGGRVLANGSQSSAPAALKQLDALLKMPSGQ